MRSFKFPFFLTIIVPLIISGCSSQPPYNVKNDNAARIIAVMAVDNKATDGKASMLLRNKIINELYLKGYTKLSPEIIDKKMESLYNKESKGGYGIVAPQVVKELTGADAAMYCSLMESKRSVGLFFASVSVSASCELRSAQAGEVTWSARHKANSTNFDVTGNRLEIKSRAAFEEVMDEVVTKIMETMPDGPKLQG